MVFHIILGRIEVGVVPVAGDTNTGVPLNAVPPVDVTDTLAVPVQPLVPVPVTEYRPATLTARAVAELPFSQRYDVPPLAVICTALRVQESVPLEVTLMFGAVVLLVIVILAVPVQAFAPVPVTV